MLWYNQTAAQNLNNELKLKLAQITPSCSNLNKIYEEIKTNFDSTCIPQEQTAWQINFKFKSWGDSLGGSWVCIH